MTAAKKLNDLNIHIEGVEVDSLLGQGNFSRVYSARKIDDHQSVAVKVAKKNKINQRLFQMEAMALASVNSENIVKVFHFQDGETPYLVLESVEGISLHQWLKSHNQDFSKSLKIITAIAKGLLALHEQGIVHRDLKPANILIDDNLNIKIIDLGLAENVKEKSEEEGSQRDVVGSFLYASPEQLGAILQPTDGRSDLYSLGVIFYELLTGQLPFSNSNFADLINWHTSSSYADYHLLPKGLPESLKNLIQNLLKKDPEDRPQYIGDVIFELDPGFQIDIDKNFVGRKNERVQIIQFLEDLKIYKKSNKLLIKGAPGAGKSYLISQCLKSFASHDFTKLTAKCEIRNNIPFFAIHSWVKQMVKIPEVLKILDDKSMWPGELDVARISVLRESFPYLKKVLPVDQEWMGQTTGVTEVFESFAILLKMLTMHLNLVLFVDDVQWLDSETSKFLKRLNKLSHQIPLLIIYSSRNDTDSLESLNNFEEHILGKNPVTFSLEGFNEKETVTQIKRLLGEKKISKKIIDIIVERTEGNPFAIKEYIKTMQESNWLNYRWETWEMSEHSLASIKLPSSVLDVILQRVDLLTTETKNFLQIAALYGVKFDPDIICKVANFHQDKLVKVINESLAQRLIIQDNKEEFIFVHDRVVEALIESLPKDLKKEIHYKLAKVSIDKNKNIKEDYYSIAEHLIESGDIASDNEIVEWCAKAAEEAVLTHLNSEAERYYEHVFKAAHNSQIPLHYNVYFHVGDLFIRVGVFERATSYLQKAIELCEDKHSRASIRLKLIKSFFGSLTINEEGGINDQFRGVFKELDDWTVRFSIINVISLFVSLFMNLLWIAKWWPKVNKRQRLLSEAHYLYGLLKYHEGDFIFAMVHSWRSYFIANRYGPCLELSKAANQAGIAFGSIGIKFAAKFMLDKGRKIADDFVDRRLKTECEFYEALIIDILGDPIKSGKQLDQLLKKRGHYLHPIDFLNAQFALLWNYGLRGHIGKLISEFELAYNYFQKQVGISDLARIIFESHYAGVVCLRGGSEKDAPFQFNDENNLVIMKSNKYAVGNVVQIHLLQKITQDNLKESEVDIAVSIYKKYCRIPPLFTIFIPIANYFIWKAIAYSQLYLENKTKPLKKKLKKSMFDLWIAGLKHPTYRTYYEHIKAILLFGEGKFEQALVQLDRASNFAKKYEVPWVELECHYYRYLIYKELDREEFVKTEISTAFHIAKKYGLSFRLRALKVDLSNEETSHSSMTTSSSTFMIQGKTQSSVINASWNLHGQKQFDALKNLSLSLSPVLEIEKQQRIAIKSIMETMGAERGFLYSIDEIRKKRNLILGMDRDGSLYKDDQSISSTVLKTIQETLEPLVFTGSNETQLQDAGSVIAKDIRSIIAAPLLLGEKFIGIIYFDNRLIRGAFTHKDIELLMAMANMVAFSLEMAQKAQLEISKREFEKDLEVSSFVQQLFIPNDRDFEGEDYDYSFHYEPAAKVGGDWIWLDKESKEELTFIIGDVTGHGMGSAMITSLVAGVLNCQWYKERALKTVFNSMHRSLVEICDSQYGMTCFGFKLSTKDGRLETLSSGCPPIFVLREKECLVWGSGGTILGFQEFQPEHFVDQLHAGDRLVIFTDGIYEVKNKQDQEFGVRRLQRYLLKNNQNKNASQLKSSILKEVKIWTEGRGLDDDLTLLVFDYKKSA
ncbi:MAG: protein kinase [Bdellovibrionaceae bacterium]|nr:protein kinase [Pseudobdellovibrionaceae bacterium]